MGGKWVQVHGLDISVLCVLTHLLEVLIFYFLMCSLKFKPSRPVQHTGSSSFLHFVSNDYNLTEIMPLLLTAP